jgi:hypothetical protein
MIGVMARPEEHAAICDFFELFKTPWEFHRSGSSHDVLLCSTDEDTSRINAQLVLLYQGAGNDDAALDTLRNSGFANSRTLLHKDFELPIYSQITTFPGRPEPMLIQKETNRTAAYLSNEQGRSVAHLGYNLFAEVAFLLTLGQPCCNASTPTLELHIRLLRQLIVESGVNLVEIPPVPQGYRFIVCLTHDVDHPSIRRHKLDRTMLGFLYRATIGSALNVLRGRATLKQMLQNWVAALSLPLVFLNWARDFWLEFVRYTTLEKGLPSSFFVIPFSGRSGRTRAGAAPRHRAAGYGAADIAPYLRQLKSAGCEIGLHGIDAWIDSSSGIEELREIKAITGAEEIGVRMHWLYFDENSPLTLENAGVNYDSTVGYNNQVGYRAGTTQVYKPLQAQRLLELPLHIMDTALFYPAHLHLTTEEAGRRIRGLVDNAADLGGCLTVNWHDRSIVPERLWQQPYLDLIDEAQAKGAWFATATQTVSWFRKRRETKFEFDSSAVERVKLKEATSAIGDLPAISLRIHTGPKSQNARVTREGCNPSAPCTMQ